MTKMKYVFKATMDPCINFTIVYEQFLFRLVGLHDTQKNREQNMGQLLFFGISFILTGISYNFSNFMPLLTFMQLVALFLIAAESLSRMESYS